jgi:PAS domain S-box-containing protein
VGGELPNQAELTTNVLVVDDNPANLTAVGAVLEPLGQRVVLARSGEEALHQLLIGDYAVVLLDVMMPGMTGFDVARMMRARERTKNVPIIFFTAKEPDPRDVVQGYLHRASDYLVKPFDPDVLRAKVSVFVDLFRAREAAQQLAREEERRRQAEHERRRLYTLLMRAPAAVAVITGRDQMFELANERFCKLFGRSDLVGKRLIDLFPQPEAARLLQLLAEVQKSGEPFSGTEFLLQLDRSQDGSGVLTDGYFDFSLEILRDDDGHVRGLMGAVTDVTDYVNARRIRDDFLGIASHELKTPLTTLRLTADGMANALTKGNASPERLLSKVQVIRKQLGRLERLIHDLLDVSRIAAGRLPLTLEEVDLTALAQEVVERFAEELAAVGCETTVRAERPMTGHWDRLRLDQVLTNLLTNAMKYGKKRPIEVIVDGDDDTARLTVRDHGIGIAPEHQARIFERFERAVSARDFGGLGLGLWIVSRVVQELSGRVEVRSEPGAGATFVVELPRHSRH